MTSLLLAVVIGLVSALWCVVIARVVTHGRRQHQTPEPVEHFERPVP